MWVIKTHGVTFYVNHVTAEIPWSTKETPNNPSTKGSIKFKRCKLTIDSDNCATLSKLGLLDRNLPTPHLPYDRIIVPMYCDLTNAIIDREFKHGMIKHVDGACGSEYIITEITNRDDMLMLALKYPNQYRVLNANEAYYKDYDNEHIHIEMRGDEGFDDEEDD